MKIDFESGFKAAYEQNIKAIQDEIKKEPESWSKTLKEKVHNRAIKYSSEESSVITAILSCDEYAKTFAIDPSRQSFHQHFAANFIKTIPGVLNFKELPNLGPNALWTYNGKIIDQEEKKRLEKAEVENTDLIHSIDFYFEFETKSGKIGHVYASHKYTRWDNGGAQTHQKNDMALFLNNGLNAVDPSNYFLAIGDGEYYTGCDPEGKTKLDKLNINHTDGKSQALTTNDIEDFIRKHQRDNF